MTAHFIFSRSTIHRLHQQVNRNILRNHKQQTRHESTKPQQNTSNNASHTTSSSSSPQQPKQTTIPGPSWAWIDPFMRPLRAYGRMQARSPLTTQFESTLIIYYLGDTLSQSLSTDVFTTAPYEPIRGLRAMLIGALSSIPSYKWFIFLGTHFNYSSHMASIAVKILVNQTFFTPLFNTYFFGMQTVLAGGSFAEAKERVIKTVPVSWRNSWKVWPVVTAFSFTFVPWQFRNVFAGVIAIGWQGYLSWLNRKEERREEVLGLGYEMGQGQGQVYGQAVVEKEKERVVKKKVEGEKKVEAGRKAEVGRKVERRGSESAKRADEEGEALKKAKKKRKVQRTEDNANG